MRKTGKLISRHIASSICNKQSNAFQSVPDYFADKFLLHQVFLKVLRAILYFHYVQE
jgi:hypothetical protein